VTKVRSSERLRAQPDSTRRCYSTGEGNGATSTSILPTDSILNLKFSILSFTNDKIIDEVVSLVFR
jgi:hypothetical protein